MLLVTLRVSSDRAGDLSGRESWQTVMINQTTDPLLVFSIIFSTVAMIWSGMALGAVLWLINEFRKANENG